MTRARYGDGTSSHYVYDQGANGIGRLTSMTDPGPITTSWSYTAIGRVATKTQTLGSGTGTRTHQLAYSYNPTTGQLTSVTYPSGKLISYTYGAASKDLEAIAIDGQPVASGITYHPFGGVKSFTLGNGQAWSNSLDQDGRVVAYSLGGVTYTIAWDAANRISGITSDNPATDQSLRLRQPGSDHRLCLHPPKPGLRLRPDRQPARQSRCGRRHADRYHLQHRSGQQPHDRHHQPRHRLQLRSSRQPHRRWPHHVRLQPARPAGPGAHRQRRDHHDVQLPDQRHQSQSPENRTKQRGAASKRVFVYDDQARLIGEYDNLGRARIEHVWLDDRPVAAIIYGYSGTSTTPNSTVVSYVEIDHLGTPRLITNASRQKRWSWDSAPYGDTLAHENPEGLGIYAYNLRFPGQYFDKETNHHYNHHRDYESTSGRYVQSDPIGIKGGLNTYLYAMAAPTKYIDSTGNAATLTWCFGGPIPCVIGGTIAVGSLIWASSNSFWQEVNRTKD